MINPKSFFGSEQDTERSPSSRVVGGIGYWLLHLVLVTFAIYSGAHGVSASLRYAGNSEFAQIAQIIGILVIETVLLGLYLAWLNGKITGAGQSIAAGVTFALGFSLALMGIIADSQINSGNVVSPMIELYLRWGLPIAPGFMALGALLVHMLDPRSLQFYRIDRQRRELEDYEFSARMALEKARAEEELSKRGLQILSRKSVLRELESIYQSAEFREAIKRTAVDRAPELFSEAGILIGKVTIPGEAIETPEDSETAPIRPAREREKAGSPNGHARGGEDDFLS